MVATMGLFGDLAAPRDIDAVVRAQLADSLVHIVNKAGSYLDVDRGRLDAALEQIRVSKQDPGVFARYFDLIFAVNANQFANANTLFDELIARTTQPVSFAIVPYTRNNSGRTMTGLQNCCLRNSPTSIPWRARRNPNQLQQRK